MAAAGLKEYIIMPQILEIGPCDFMQSMAVPMQRSCAQNSQYVVQTLSHTDRIVDRWLNSELYCPSRLRSENIATTTKLGMDANAETA